MSRRKRNVVNVVPIPALTASNQILISNEEHHKVLKRNEQLAKENALLKDKLSKLRLENLKLKEKETNKMLELDSHMISESFLTALKVIVEENNSIQKNLGKVQDSFNRIKEAVSCPAIPHEVDLDRDVEQDLEQTHQSSISFNNGTSNEFETFEELDISVTSQNSRRSSRSRRSSGCSSRSSRYRKSKEDQEQMRRLSWVKLKNRFHLNFPEMSTIIELSRELRSSSLPSKRESGLGNGRISSAHSKKDSLASNLQTSTSCTHKQQSLIEIENFEPSECSSPLTPKENFYVLNPVQTVFDNKKMSLESVGATNTQSPSVYDFVEDSQCEVEKKVAKKVVKKKPAKKRKAKAKE